MRNINLLLHEFFFNAIIDVAKVVFVAPKNTSGFV